MSKAELQARLGRLVAQMDVAEGLAGAGDVKLVHAVIFYARRIGRSLSETYLEMCFD